MYSEYLEIVTGVKTEEFIYLEYLDTVTGVKTGPKSNIYLQVDRKMLATLFHFSFSVLQVFFENFTANCL